MALAYLLDTTICIYIAKQKPLSVLEKFDKLTVGDVGMSAITYGELEYGAQKSIHVEKAMNTIHQLASLIPPLPIPIIAQEHYGEIRSTLEKDGKIIGNNDLWIASHAMSLDITLVTNNMKEFKRIKGLKIDNWVN